MSDEGQFTVIVQFETAPEEQARALDEIGAYVDDFLRRQPGFLRSWLHRSLDGAAIAHYALWTSQAHFRAAGEKARHHPALPALRRYQPRGQYYEVWRGFSGE